MDGTEEGNPGESVEGFVIRAPGENGETWEWRVEG